MSLKHLLKKIIFLMTLSKARQLTRLMLKIFLKMPFLI